MIELNYVKNEQNRFLNHLQTIEGIKYPEERFKVPNWLILSMLSELIEVLNDSKIHKFWDVKEVNREHLKEELTDLLSHIGNLANFLGKDMYIEKEVETIDNIKKHFIKFAGDILSLQFSKSYARAKFNIILEDYIKLINYLDFRLEDIKEAYFIKMRNNYKRFE